jgi:hypothetical protein
MLDPAQHECFCLVRMAARWRGSRRTRLLARAAVAADAANGSADGPPIATPGEVAVTPNDADTTVPVPDAEPDLPLPDLMADVDTAPDLPQPDVPPDVPPEAANDADTTPDATAQPPPLLAPYGTAADCAGLVNKVC